MAERYHDSKGKGYASMEHETKRMEALERGMVSNDSSAIANMPQEVMIKPYPRTGPYMPEDLDDTLTGIDRQMDMDDSKRKATMKPHKY